MKDPVFKKTVKDDLYLLGSFTPDDFIGEEGREALEEAIGFCGHACRVAAALKNNGCKSAAIRDETKVVVKPVHAKFAGVYVVKHYDDKGKTERMVTVGIESF